ncbi:hypothetical protein FAI41_03625 [Acetobacteraceae bacterium]|nr:hypothetical protein FAI41_03625 [Acetobacteraceae bacterium]
MSPKIRRLLPGEIKTEILQLIQESQEIRVAVAWAQAGHEVELALRANAKKIKKLVVGMDFNGTDPAFLGFYGKHNLALGKATGTFHPKIYYFQKGKYAACIEGSTNFTKSAFERNAESGTLITGNKNDEFFKKTRFLIDQYAESGANLKPNDLMGYETISAALKKQEIKKQKIALKERRKKEKEQKKKRDKERKKFKAAKAKEKKRQKEQKRRAKTSSTRSGFFFKKKSRKQKKSLFGFRFKFIALLALIGAIFYYKPIFSHSVTQYASNMLNPSAQHPLKGPHHHPS